MATCRRFSSPVLYLPLFRRGVIKENQELGEPSKLLANSGTQLFRAGKIGRETSEFLHVFDIPSGNLLLSVTVDHLDRLIYR